MVSEDMAGIMYQKLRDGDLKGVLSLMSEELAGERTEKFGITKTPVLNSLGKRVGKFLVGEEWEVDRLVGLWRLSFSEGEGTVHGLLGGREARLIVISALSVLSKRWYEGTKDFVLRVLDTIQDWETCDQMALRVVVNLAVQNEEEVFSLLESWLDSDNKWVRRLAVATLPPYIRMKGQKAEVCLALINNVMRERDKDVKKAVGWALREISKKDPRAVYGFLQRWVGVKDKVTEQIVKDGMKKLSKEEQRKLLSLIGS